MGNSTCDNLISLASHTFMTLHKQSLLTWPFISVGKRTEIHVREGYAMNKPYSKILKNWKMYDCPRDALVYIGFNWFVDANTKIDVSCQLII